jgi:hypothetical protein
MITDYGALKKDEVARMIAESLELSRHEIHHVEGVCRELVDDLWSQYRTLQMGLEAEEARSQELQEQYEDMRSHHSVELEAILEKLSQQEQVNASAVAQLEEAMARMSKLERKVTAGYRSRRPRRPKKLTIRFGHQQKKNREEEETADGDDWENVNDKADVVEDDLQPLPQPASS